MAILLAGCGTASPGAPSGRDPAKLAPASSLVYLSLTVRPQGNQAAQTQATLRKLFGNSADSSIHKTVDGLLKRIGASYSGSVRPWLGQRIGLVVTQLAVSGASGGGKSGVAVIAPTQDPSAARAFIAKLVKRNPGEVGKVTDGYAVFGGAFAAREILATTPATSLASNPSYQDTTSQLGSSTAAIVYLSLRRFAEQLAARMSMAGASAGELRQFLSRIGVQAGAAAGLTLAPSAIRIDTAETGVRQSAHSSHPDVGDLPAGSWLALATGAFAPGSQKQLEAGLRLGLLGGLAQGASSTNPLAGAVAGRLAFVERDLLPALGPLSLAVGGTSPLNLSAGLKLAPASAAAASRLLGLLRAQLTRSSSLIVTGRATHFKAAVPTGSSILVNQSGRQVVATYGFPNQAGFLSPAAKLSQTPAYQQAVSQLPSGGSVPFYISFPPIAALVQLLDHSPSAPKTVHALDKLSYLIAGGTPGHVRIVLGLR